uniref:Major facilitator superfamily (MFS) profile domain-containing protein n=1 Tax=Solanum lycopersicum TaxID=4081 RepID=A0A3Q7GSC3_SOLLC
MLPYENALHSLLSESNIQLPEKVLQEVLRCYSIPENMFGRVCIIIDKVRDFHIAKREGDIGSYAGYIGFAFMFGRTLTSAFWGVVADRYGRKPVIIFGTSIVYVRDFHIAKREEDIGSYACYTGFAFMFGRTLTSAFWGVMADRYGRKSVIIFGTSIVVVFNTLFGLSTNFWMVVVTRFLLGSLNGLLGPIKAYAAEIFREEYQALGMSTISSAWGIGLIIGPALGGFLAQVKLPEKVVVPAVYAFGDSIVDQGNNNYIATTIKCNFPPYGKDLRDGIPTGRFSNAKTPPDLIAEELGIKGLIPAYLDPNLKDEDLKTGVSFASGGCGYDPLTGSAFSILHLSDQLTLFQEYIEKLKRLVGKQETTHILNNSFYMVVAGSNDFLNNYYVTGFRKHQYDINSYIDHIVSWASNFVQELYELGARRIGIMGLPPLGCVPFQRTLQGGIISRVCVDEYNQDAQLANTKFAVAFGLLSKSLPQSKLVFIDIYNLVTDFIVNNTKYGFEEVDKGCCGTGTIEVSTLCNKYSAICEDDTKYLFWDSFHPTEKGYKVLIDHIFKTQMKNLL